MNAYFERFYCSAAKLWLAAAFVAVTPSVGGCDRAERPIAQPGPSRPAEKVYTTRGEIRMLPGRSRASELVIHHEAIDDFVNPGGSKGMNSMEMPMLVGPGVSLEGLAVGDKVELDLAVWYGPEFKSLETFRLSRLRKLPAETTLHFGVATPTLGP